MYPTSVGLQQKAVLCRIHIPVSYTHLYYTRDIERNHEDFIDAVFHTPVPMPAAEQKEAFQSILAETVCEDCSYEVVQSVHEQLAGMIEEHKANKVPEPLVVDKKTMARVLESCGVSEPHVAEFEQKYDCLLYTSRCV